MKKILFLLLAGLTFANAGKIFLDYEFNMPFSKMENLEETTIKNFPKPFKTYKDEYNQHFIFLDNQLKVVYIAYQNMDLKTEIEKVIQNGFTLQSIKYANKYGDKEIKNVGELIKEIEYQREASEIFNSAIKAVLIFHGKEKEKIVFDFTEGIERDVKDCVACNFIEGAGESLASFGQAMIDTNNNGCFDIGDIPSLAMSISSIVGIYAMAKQAKARAMTGNCRHVALNQPRTAERRISQPPTNVTPAPTAIPMPISCSTSFRASIDVPFSVPVPAAKAINIIYRSPASLIRFKGERWQEIVQWKINR